MTVGVMVGGHGREWACLPPPSPVHSDSPCQPIPTPTPAPAPVSAPAPVPVPAPQSPRQVVVVAGADLPRGVSTHPHPARRLALALTQDSFRMPPTAHPSPRPLNLQVRDGVLVTEEQTDLSAWLPLLPLAPDVHAETATLAYTHTPAFPNRQGEATLRVTLTRPLKKGETPALWFSSEVAAHLGLPFLNFSHVRGGVYTCPHCDRQFPAPNPLKVHLAAHCDTLAPTLLWARLASPPASHVTNPWFSPLLPLPAPLAPKTPGPDTRPLERSHGASPGTNKPVSPDSTSCHVGSFGHPSHPQEPRSAFRRVGGRTEGASPKLHTVLPEPPPGPSRHTARTSTVHPLLLGPQPASDASVLLPPRLLLGALLPTHSPTHPITSAPPFMPVMPLAGSARPLLGAGPAGAVVDPCAEMETLVSNLGRSRRGHLCLYCGKVYSRKYGLKIHIRTHTGYKPLKCKVCLRPFGDPSNLNKHVRLHAQGETPYRCDHCGKVLVRRRDLDRHIRSRHPQAIPPPRTLTDTETETETETEDEEDDDVLEVHCDDLRAAGSLRDPATGSC